MDVYHTFKSRVKEFSERKIGSEIIGRKVVMSGEIGVIARDFGKEANRGEDSEPR